MNEYRPTDTLVFMFARTTATCLLIMGLIGLCYVAVGNAQPFEAVVFFVGALIGYLLETKAAQRAAFFFYTKSISLQTFIKGNVTRQEKVIDTRHEK